MNKAALLSVVISQSRGDDPSRRALEGALVAALAQRPELDVIVLPHLYDLDSSGPAVQLLRSLPGDSVVFSWLYPRAVYWLLRASRVACRMGATCFTSEDALELPPDRQERRRERTLWCIDLRESAEPGAYVAEIERLLGTAVPGEFSRGCFARPAQVAEDAAPRWYPVIDYVRCTGCLDCVSFCLFKVLAQDERGAVVVAHAEACQDGCPACARICPTAAILLPEHRNPSIAGDARAGSVPLKLDLSQLFCGARIE